MAKQAVYFNVDLTITEGKLDAFEDIAKAMIAATQKESGALAYEWHLSSDRTRCRLLETYADESAVLAHLMGPMQELVPRLLKVSSLAGFEVYGYPGPKAAEMLAGLGAKFFQHWHGLHR
jgi:quinol monooxygenase YgiN